MSKSAHGQQAVIRHSHAGPGQEAQRDVRGQRYAGASSGRLIIRATQVMHLHAPIYTHTLAVQLCQWGVPLWPCDNIVVSVPLWHEPSDLTWVV